MKVRANQPVPAHRLPEHKTHSTTPLFLQANISERTCTNIRTTSTPSLYSSHLEVACIDTSTSKTVIGLKQAQAYFPLIPVTFSMEPTRNTFKFCDGIEHSLAHLAIWF